VVSVDRFCVILRSNAAIVSPAFRLVGAWRYIILLSNAAIVSSVWSMAGNICVIRACLKHASVHGRLMLRVWLVLMLIGSHFSFLMLILISVLGFLLYNFVYFLSFIFVVQYFSCSRQCACYRSDFQYCWHWLTWPASSVSILHSDELHLWLNVIVTSLCSIDCSWLLSVHPVTDSFSNKKMHTFSIHAHQSTCETVSTSLWRRKTKPASFNDLGLWFWRSIKFVVHFRDEFLSFLCCGTPCLKNNFSFFNQYTRIFSCILDDQRAISLPPVIASDNSSIVFIDDTSWRSSAAAPLVKLGLLSSLCTSKSVTPCSSIFCPLYRLCGNVSAGLHCHCKIVTWMFLDLAATLFVSHFCLLCFNVF